MTRPAPEGKVGHAELVVGDAPKQIGGSPVAISLYKRRAAELFGS